MGTSMHVINWDDFLSGRWPASDRHPSTPLALTIGVFDGLHIGHRALISRIRAEESCIPTVVTFRENPMKTISRNRSALDIFSLAGKLAFLEALGVELSVLIDFSPEFSMINGRDFIGLLLGCHPVKLIAVGENFRCGQGSDTGATEIRHLAETRGVETWIAPPVMDEGQPVSSSRIRQALAAGRGAEADRLLGEPIIISPKAGRKWKSV